MGIKVGIFGASGRVGELLIQNVIADENLDLISVFDNKEVTTVLPKGVTASKTIKEFLELCDLVVDFTSPKGTEALLTTALESSPTALVIGTTGLEPHQQNLLQEASGKMPILYATNMSVGVAVLNSLVYQASQKLSDFNIEITEMHHRFKKDAPSGTALTLAESAAKGRDKNLDDVRVSGRDGIIGERSEDEIAVMALRGGDIVGEHIVGFYADGEYVRLQHTATNRNTFALGALRAGKWLVEQKNDLYSIQDFLQL